MTPPHSPPSLFSIVIPPDFIEEFEERQDRERMYWRRRAREARDRRLVDERLGKGSSHPNVQAAYKAAGNGPKRAMEVSYSMFSLTDS